MHEPISKAVLTYEILGVIILILVVIFWIFYREFKKRRDEESRVPFKLTRSGDNPVLSPREHLLWEQMGVFNPAALLLDGSIHLLYRAVGGDGVSRIGYAMSSDGLNFSSGDTYPIFSFEKPRLLYRGIQKYDPVMYPSGGSCGGCEDPRLTALDGVIYMTFNAFDGWDFIRIGLSMIDEKDFLNKRWSAWSKPILLSPPGEIQKNWMLFPEKIDGKFAILHSISPEIEIEYRDSISSTGVTEPFIESSTGARSGGRKDEWDNRIRSAGPPPVKTEKGWLVLYHANQDTEPHKYKLGAKLLDLNNPKKVIAQSILPMLEPDEWYENDSKPGIVYACGAITKEHDGKETLFVYYGGGDKYVCAAHTPLHDLLNWIINYGSVN